MHRRQSLTLKTLKTWLTRTGDEIWGAAQSIERDAALLATAAETLERLTHRAQAQAVIDRLVPDVEELLELLRSRPTDMWDDPLAVKAIDDCARRIGDRLGVD